MRCNDWPEPSSFGIAFQTIVSLFARISAIIGAIFHFPLRNADSVMGVKCKMDMKWKSL